MNTKTLSYAAHQRQNRIRYFWLAIFALAALVLGACTPQAAQEMNDDAAVSGVVFRSGEVTMADGSTESIVTGANARLVVRVETDGTPVVLGPDGIEMSTAEANQLITRFSGYDLGIGNFVVPTAQMAQIADSGLQLVQASYREEVQEDNSTRPALIIKVNGSHLGTVYLDSGTDLFEAIENSGILAGAGMPNGTAALAQIALQTLVSTETDADVAILTPAFDAADPTDRVEFLWPALSNGPAPATPDPTCFVTVASGDGPLTTLGRISRQENLTAEQQTILEAELMAQHDTGVWKAGQRVEVTCPADSPIDTGTELGSAMPTGD